MLPVREPEEFKFLLPTDPQHRGSIIRFLSVRQVLCGIFVRVADSLSAQYVDDFSSAKVALCLPRVFWHFKTIQTTLKLTKEKPPAPSQILVQGGLDPRPGRCHHFPASSTCEEDPDHCGLFVSRCILPERQVVFHFFVAFWSSLAPAPPGPLPQAISTELRTSLLQLREGLPTLRPFFLRVSQSSLQTCSSLSRCLHHHSGFR